MKLVLIIIFFVLVPLLFALVPTLLYSQVDETGKKFNFESSGSFSAKIIRALKITNDKEQIDLGIFTAGQTKIYDTYEKVASFELSGQPSKEVSFKAVLYCSNVEMTVEAHSFDYKDGIVWKEFSDTPSIDGNVITYKLTFYLDNTGKRALRINPEKIAASSNLNTSDNIILHIELTYEYTDI